MGGFGPEHPGKSWGEYESFGSEAGPTSLVRASTSLSCELQCFPDLFVQIPVPLQLVNNYKGMLWCQMQRVTGQKAPVSSFRVLGEMVRGLGSHLSPPPARDCIPSTQTLTSRALATLTTLHVLCMYAFLFTFFFQKKTPFTFFVI